MKILPVNNCYTKPQNQTTFGERDDWSDGKLDPWVVEKKELNKEFLRLKNDLFAKLDNNEISLSRFNCELDNLKKWLKNEEKAIAEKWHKVCINYEPPKKNFFQRLFKLSKSIR